MDENSNGNPSYLEGNSKTDKAEREKSMQKVVQGKVTARKQPTGKRLRESLGLEETRKVGDYLVWDVLIPAAKEMVADLVKRGIDVFLYGGADSFRRDSYSRGGRSHVSYEGYYRDRSRPAPSNSERRYRYNGGGFSDFREFVFDDKRDAEMVLSELCEAIDVYGWAKVSDFYSLVGETERNFTAQGYGWEALGSARIERVRDGWVIDLPRPVSNRS